MNVYDMFSLILLTYVAKKLQKSCVQSRVLLLMKKEFPINLCVHSKFLLITPFELSEYLYLNFVVSYEPYKSKSKKGRILQHLKLNCTIKSKSTLFM